MARICQRCQHSNEDHAKFCLSCGGMLEVEVADSADPLLGKVIARDAESYQYLHESIRRFPPQHELVRRMKAAGFGNVSFRNMTMGVVALHTGWRL